MADRQIVWSAYTFKESGRPEVYLQPYPDPGPRLTVSREGGQGARWSRDGKTLFYIQGDAVMAATLRLGPALNVVERRRLFSGKFLTRSSG